MTESISNLIKEISDIMDGNLHSVWLYGSVVLGDFRPGWSDIDFIALTNTRISEGQAQKLVSLRQSMSQREPENPFYRLFEGIIAEINEYRNNSFSRLVYWGTSGQRITDAYKPDIFASLELARYGIAVYGMNDRSIFAVPRRGDILNAVRAHYETIRKYAKRTDERIYSCGWLLDIARCVYTLRYNDVIAKTDAGIWALDNHIFPDESKLRRAIEIRQNPLNFVDDDTMRWLANLGPTVQKYADVLENELEPLTNLR